MAPAPCDAIGAGFEDELAAGLEVQLDATDMGQDDDGDLGWVFGEQTVQFPVDGEMMTGTGNYVIVQRQEDDGVWRIVVDTWNDAP
jgi:ketosteroid isomerase-like protein